MIVIRINGGFGNQLFQYAIALICAEKYKRQKVYLDIDDYNRNYSHTGYYIPQVYNSQFELIDEERAKELYYGLRYNNIYRKLNAIFGSSKVNRAVDIINGIRSHTSKNKKYVITEKAYNIFDPQVLGMLENKDYYLNGYWQNCYYFLGYEKLIQDKLSMDFLVNELSEEHKKIMQQNNKIAVHLRRGDYVGSRLDVCGSSYYQNAIKYIKDRVADPSFIVFTDDKQYANEFFLNEDNVQIISGNEQHCELDILLMSMCDHNIIANSTFSFWGAFLNKNENKIVVAPKYYIVDEIFKYETQFMESWVYINNI